MRQENPDYAKCLLIDDDSDDREIFEIAINDMNKKIKCNFFENGVEAIHSLNNNHPVPDIIFLDLNMPLMTGMQCLMEIKKIPRINNTPVIIYSTSSDPRFMHESIRNGAHSYIIKPPSVRELTEILRRTFSSTIGI